MDDNFWGFVLSGVQTVTDALFGNMPDWQPIGLVGIVTDWMSSTPVLLFAFVNQFINLTLVILLLTAIITLDIVRGVVAAWMWIKNAIPVVG